MQTTNNKQTSNKELIRRKDEILAELSTRIYIKESQIEEMENVIDETRREVELLRNEAYERIKELYNEGHLK